MIHRFVIPTFLGLAALAPAWGQPAVISTSPAEQEKTYAELAAKTYHAEKATDADGNIIFVCFNQHDAFAKERPGAPGLSDADMALLRKFPKLEGITLQRQPLSDAGYAVLAEFPNLRVVSLPDPKTNKSQSPETRPTSRLITCLDNARGLQVLDLTHTFNMQKDPPVLPTMQGFPDLKVLFVDVGLSDDFDELYPFLLKSTNLERLKLHRCTFSEEQMGKILAALPKLRVLEIKPAGNTPGKRWSYQSLKLLAAHPNIEILRLIHPDALPLPWDDGLEHLAEAKSLKVLMFPTATSIPKPSPDRVVKDEDLARLVAARPDLKINVGKLPDYYKDPAPFVWEIGPR